MGIAQQTFREAADMAQTWRRPLLLTHIRPDGDAIGSLVAMRSILRRLGAPPLAMLFDAGPQRYAWLWGDEPLTRSRSPAADAESFAPDGIVILDTCSRNQLEPILPWLDQAVLPKIAVDHHVTRDELADVCLIDESASAACLIVLEWARAADWSLDPAARNALFVGIATDTGWFSYSNTDARTLEAAACLVNEGVEPNALYEPIYNTERAERVRLLGAALDTLELHDEGRIAVMSLDADAFRRAGAAAGDTEDIVNEPMRIGGVEASVLLVAHEEGRVRVSLRSKPPSDRVPEINVAEAAEALGGGGHPRAAGARVTGSPGSVKTRVLEKLISLRRWSSPSGSSSL